MRQGMNIPGYNISQQLAPSDLIATIRIQAVPEPSTIALCGLGLPVLIGRAAWRRRARPIG
ncbi:PEP-CTERM sorting domain-containing protein [Tautonia sociabilis]|uniref:PEP-CTERM sorting domain-containing protein n=1 Tax=Tautonia sociabilis TaxID=2080755 RepID=A0A432MHK5_9BACT|nr:PEP-CTERM sorting domain-containing protein [Tautonia sociabilis]RUL86828.1 PEP-CTERM sorting domain-containing protein [Tautonia sociabilis]